MKIEFVDFKPTPNEKYVGIATINFDDKIYLRFKVIPKKDAAGYFCAPSSLKASGPDGDEYLPCFVIDSNFIKERIDSEIRKNVMRFMTEPAPSRSVFSNEEIPF